MNNFIAFFIANGYLLFPKDIIVNCNKHIALNQIAGV